MSGCLGMESTDFVPGSRSLHVKTIRKLDFIPVRPENDHMAITKGSSDPEPICDVCGLELEHRPAEIDGHPAIRLLCLVHGERRTWEPFRPRG